MLKVVIEIPKGSRNKYEWDERLGAIKLDRFLFSSVAYPSDYGFVPETLAEDGDPLDAIVCVSAATFPGCRIVVRVIVTVDGWRSRAEALTVIQQARERHRTESA